ncbi:MAG TPA: glycosyltransferase family 39 protein [Pirellulales bacterium]|nr:glycosyltransferase family 39 protein [Pirellulales bacterium]
MNCQPKVDSRGTSALWDCARDAEPWEPPTGTSPLDARRRTRLIWGFLVLGLVARTVRFLLRFPLWEDECFLAANFIDRGYLDLLQPLNYHQVAPLGFLWIELSCVKLLGFNEWSLRLYPFLASIASLFLFRRLAMRLLEGTALVLAVALFSVTYSGVRYAAEAKPYGTDQFVALVLLSLAVEWWRRPDQRRWLWGLTACVPLSIVLSYPSVFVAGGISLVMALVMWVQRHQADAPARDRPSYVAFNLVLVASFLGVVWLAARHQADAELGWMQNYWKDNLPSLTSPARFAWWLLVTHTGDLLAIPLGGERGASTLSFVLCLVGLAAMVRARRVTLLAFCLAPAALNIVAALLGRYPYGGHVKFSQYLAPAICLLLGAGGAAWLGMRRGAPAPVRRTLAVGLAFCALIAVATMARDFASPYKSRTDLRYRDFARCFWFNMEFAGEAVCLKTDLGREFAPGTFRDLGWSAMYLCNQRIYSPRHARGEPPRFDRVSEQWPLRCVEFKAEVYRYDQAAFERWLAAMQSRWDLVARDTLPFPCYDQRGRNVLCVDAVEVYKFVPKRAATARR